MSSNQQTVLHCQHTTVLLYCQILGKYFNFKARRPAIYTKHICETESTKLLQFQVLITVRLPSSNVSIWGA